MTDARTIIPLGREPVTDENPTGEPLDIERLDWFKTEIGKSQSVRDEHVNWNAIVAIAVKILQQQSKDFRIASYLCCALTEIHAHSGLNVGLAVLQDMLITYWDDAYPTLERPQRRAVMLEWLSDRAVLTVHTKAPPEIEQCEAILKQLDFITRYFQQKLADTTPYFAALQHYYQHTLEELNNPAPEPEIDEDAAEPNQEVPENITTAAPVIDTDAITPEKIKELRTGLDQYANFFDKTVPQLMASIDADGAKK